MKISTSIVVVLLISIIFFSSGCGSIYIGGTTHTHFYGNEEVSSDEADIDEAARFIKYLRHRMNKEAEPMKDFRWTDKTNKKEDQEF